jgi:hypothetical protein
LHVGPGLPNLDGMPGSHPHHPRLTK